MQQLRDGHRWRTGPYQQHDARRDQDGHQPHHCRARGEGNAISHAARGDHDDGRHPEDGQPDPKFFEHASTLRLGSRSDLCTIEHSGKSTSRSRWRRWTPARRSHDRREVRSSPPRTSSSGRRGGTGDSERKVGRGIAWKSLRSDRRRSAKARPFSPPRRLVRSLDQRTIVCGTGRELTVTSALHSSDRSAAGILAGPEPVLVYPLMADRAHIRRPIGSRPEGQDTCGSRESQPGDNPYGSHARSPRPTREA